MSQKSTHYLFQYTQFVGKEQLSIINEDFSFDVEQWISFKIEKLIASTPDVPDELIKRILKEVNIC